MVTKSNQPKSDSSNGSSTDLQSQSNHSLPANKTRRKLKFSRKLIVIGAFAIGLLTILASLANYIEQEDLTEVIGEVQKREEVKYWEDYILYLNVTGTAGRFKYEKGNPGYEEFNKQVAVGVEVHLWVEQIDSGQVQPSKIFAADVNGIPLIHFKETQSVHNRENGYVMLMGVVFCLLSFWIWHRATRPLPTSEEIASYENYLLQRAEEYPRLFIAVHIVTKIREWGESIPKLSDLFTAFLFFWILPLYMVFIFVTVYSYRKLVQLFCISYWVLLVCLLITAGLVHEFPGGDEYPALGQTGSRLFYAYLILNIAYGGAIWIWGTLMYEEEADNQNITDEKTAVVNIEK